MLLPHIGEAPGSGINGEERERLRFGSRGVDSAFSHAFQQAGSAVCRLIPFIKAGEHLLGLVYGQDGPLRQQVQ